MTIHQESQMNVITNVNSRSLLLLYSFINKHSWNKTLIEMPENWPWLHVKKLTGYVNFIEKTFWFAVTGDTAMFNGNPMLLWFRGVPLTQYPRDYFHLLPFRC